MDTVCNIPQIVHFGDFGGAAMTTVLGYLNWRRRRKSDLSKERIRQLSECLAQFQRGEFGTIPEFINASEEWMRLGERLKELGIYFAALKKRLKEEEDSTKALITDISHQLKTPLASLRMSYELITGGAVTDDEQREFQAQGDLYESKAKRYCGLCGNGGGFYGLP